MTRVLAVVTARGGSRQIPGKNLRPLAGKPLVLHTIEAALNAGSAFYRVIVSTDDPEIADISRAAGAEVPFARPAELAADTAPSLPVVQHAARFAERDDGRRLDWVMLLQPTSPMRTADDIVQAVALADKNECDSVVSVVEAMACHPLKIKRIEDGLLRSFLPGVPEAIRRQDLEPAVFRRNGAIYLTRRDVLLDGNSLYGERIRPYVMPPERSIDIDSEFDLRLAACLLDGKNGCAS